MFLEMEGVSDVPLEELEVITPSCWYILKQIRSDNPDYSTDNADPYCMGEISLLVQGDPVAAVTWFDRAIRADPAKAQLYVLRAQAHFLLAHYDRAERDARTAIFLGDSMGYYILGRLAEAQGDINEALGNYAAGGPLILQRTGWGPVVFHRDGQFELLPSLDAPGPGRYDFASWLALAKLYEAQGLPEDAQRIYDSIMSLDPFFEIEP
jgi:tetratricopeptide (TPR) repeat protein